MPDATGALRAAALLRFGMQRLAQVGNRNGVVWASSGRRQSVEETVHVGVSQLI